MAKDKSKNTKEKEKLKKEKKTLKKLIKAQEKKEKELDKIGKKLKKREKQLQKKEEDFLNLIKDQQNPDKTDPIIEAAENSIFEGDSDNLPFKETFTPKNETNRSIESIKPAGVTEKTKKRRTRIIPNDEKKENKIQDSSSPEKPSKEYTVRQGFTLIRKMNDKKQIQDFLKGEVRKTMLEAGEQRIRQVQK